MKRNSRMLSIAAAVAMCSWAMVTARQDQPAAPSVPVAPPAGAPAAPASPIAGDEFTPQATQAIERGLEFLAKSQMPDGSVGQSGFADTGITSLAGIAFMAGGNLPGRGKYGDNVKRALDYVLQHAQPIGLLSENNGHGVMYSHGFATLFLAEVYGMTGDDVVKERLQKAIELIQKSQNAEGGWRYTPAPLDADVSVTICQVMALRAARDAGIKVEKQVIDRAIEYVKKCQNADGGFSYMLGQGGSMFPRSAAGVATLFYAGVQQGKEIDSGLEYILRYKPGQPEAQGVGQSHYFYGHYYAVQTMFLAGGKYWAEWYPAVREELIASQDVNGSWNGEVNQQYCTAMSLIILQIPGRYLPVFSGKGPGS
jgi:hypothetical protein